MQTKQDKGFVIVYANVHRFHYLNLFISPCMCACVHARVCVMCATKSGEVSALAERTAQTMAEYENEAYSPAVLLNMNGFPDRSGKRNKRQIAGGDRFYVELLKYATHKNANN